MARRRASGERVDREAQSTVREASGAAQTELMAELAAVSAGLEELRDLQRRLELGQLEPEDVPKLRAFLEGLIAEAEGAGLDGVDFARDLLDQERRD